MVNDTSDDEYFQRRAHNTTLRSHAVHTAFRRDSELANYLDGLASTLAAIYDCVLRPDLTTFDAQETRFLYEELVPYREYSPTVEGLLDRVKEVYFIATGGPIIPDHLPKDL